MRPVALILACLAVALGARPAAARIGSSPQAFASGPLIYQLELTLRGQQPLAGTLAGRTLYRYISDDGVITVDVVARGDVIEQQVMYLPLDMRRGGQVNYFLQETLGSVVGATQGLLAFRAAVTNYSTTAIRWGPITVRFIPMSRSLMQILAAR
jgi:hypothetical protein